MSQLRQSVNFFREEFKKPEIKLPAIQMAQIAAIVLFGFIVIGAYQVYSLAELKAKIKKFETQRDQMAAQYDSLQASFVAPKESPELLGRLDELKGDVVQRQKLKEFLSKEASKSLFSFASVLDALAMSDVSKVWLTQVKIKSTGNSYELRGVTQHAEAIPAYIEKLKEADALQGTSFNVFSIERDKKSSALLHFTLSSEKLDEQGEG
ncbi:MAG: hypothetical protein MI867_27185 [Pseudomonadales bacterium]|nr:hypothetical protein [Pseudomonadales bacterium]